MGECRTKLVHRGMRRLPLFPRRGAICSRRLPWQAAARRKGQLLPRGSICRMRSFPRLLMPLMMSGRQVGESGNREGSVLRLATLREDGRIGLGARRVHICPEPCPGGTRHTSCPGTLPEGACRGRMPGGKGHVLDSINILKGWEKRLRITAFAQSMARWWGIFRSLCIQALSGMGRIHHRANDLNMGPQAARVNGPNTKRHCVVADANTGHIPMIQTALCDTILCNVGNDTGALTRCAAQARNPPHLPLR
jgi:hypothetical protein